MHYMIHFRIVLIAALSVWYAGCTPSEPIVIENAWARPTPTSHASHNQDQHHGSHSGSRAAVYLNLKNSAKPQRLVHLSSAVADTIEIHHSSMDDNDIMRMRTVEFVDLPPDHSIAFEPGGYHLMLIGVEPLHEGDTFQLNLRFDSQLEVSTTVKVGHLDKE